ncbi:DUF636 domain protein [Hypoxylon cercidicola]|nr:DUF636 domain protein [Hypoxylon cercidicola]
MSTESEPEFVNHEDAWRPPWPQSLVGAEDALCAIFGNERVERVGYDDDDEIYEEEPQLFVARCHCRNIHATIKIYSTHLPRYAHICNCTLCRVTYGGFGSFSVCMPETLMYRSIQKPHAESFQRFDPPGTGREPPSRWFCRSCGAHHGHNDNQLKSRYLSFYVETALFDKKFWRWTGITFSQTTGDGGLSTWLPSVGGKELIALNTLGSRALRHNREVGWDGEERLLARCACGGVSFVIPRPSWAGRINPLARHAVSPSDPDKWKAYLDFSTDTRLTTSMPVTPWMLVPRLLLSPLVPDNLLLGTIRTYRSSTRETRGFCKVCGAAVFLKSTDRCPPGGYEILNIAMGILKAPEGVRAERWVTWRAGRPEGVEEGLQHDAELTDAIVEAHKQWSIEKYGDAPDFDII